MNNSGEIERLKERIALVNEEALFADGFEDAIIGVAERCGQPMLVVYDALACVEILMARDHMDEDDALEFFQVNTLGSWVGDNTPLFLWRKEDL